MTKRIRKSKITKALAGFLALQMLITLVQPQQLLALTGGPAQPEFSSFTPIETSDMVNLSSGDFNYNIPVMDVGGYPLNLAYDAGVTMDQEASWVGLGWNLNVGQINRQVRGIPDDFKGDQIEYENNMRDNVTVGVYAGLDPQVFGLETSDELDVKFGVNLKYNNYSGLSFSRSYGLQFGISENVTIGMQVETSATDGATISPTASISGKKGWIQTAEGAIAGSLNAGISYNSNRGLSSFSISGNVSESRKYLKFTNDGGIESGSSKTTLGSSSGKVSFSNTTLTPRKRAAFTDINGTLSVSVGADVWGLDGEVELSAMASIQKLKDPFKKEKAYGYDFTGFAETNDVLDYNREKDQAISKTTMVLPTASYTYDLYSVQGQGISGMFRPFRSQVGEIHDEFVQDESASFSLGLEIEPGSGFHTGVNYTEAPSESHTGIWDTKALRFFKQESENFREPNTGQDYEPVYYKYIGEPRVDRDQEMFDALGGYSPVALKIGGPKKSFNKFADTQFKYKTYKPDGTAEHKDLQPFNSKFRRTKRDLRNQTIQKVSKAELKNLYTSSYYEKRQTNMPKSTIQPRYGYYNRMDLPMYLGKLPTIRKKRR